MNKRTIKTICIMGFSSVFGYFINLFITPFITENIGIEAYGFVAISKTIVGYGGILTVALTSFVVRYITINYHRKELHEAQSYFVSAINATFMLTGILSVIFTVLVINLETIINIPESLIASVKMLFVVVFAAFVATTFTTAFSTGFYIKDRLDISGIIKIVSYIIEICILTLLFKIFTPSVLFVGIGSLSAAVTVLILSIICSKKLAPEFKYDARLHSNKKIRELLGNGIWNSINQLGNTLNSGLDLLVANSLLSAVQTGQVAVAKSIGTIFGVLSGVIFQPLQPNLLRAYSTDNKKLFIIELKKSMKICGFFGALAFAGFFAIGLNFYSLWLPNQDVELLNVLTLLTVFTYVMDIFLQPIYYVNTLTVKNRIPCFITIAGGLLNVFGMYVLIKYTSLGVYSVPITTVIIMLLINIFFNPIYACWCLRINKLTFYPVTIRHLVATTVMCIVFFIIGRIVNPNSWIGLIICAFIMAVIGCGIYFFIVFNKQEIISFLEKIKSKF